MGERAVPWRAKPSDAVVQSIRSLGKRRFFLVQRPGPTGFVLQEEGSETKTKVLIGSRVTCSCPKCDISRDVCVHTLFVMLRVLGVPPNNPLVWQGSLLDRELDELIHCGNRLGQKPKPKSKGQKDKAEGSGGPPARRPIDPDERCPICFDPLIEAQEKELLSCASCGNSLHGRCIYVWARHQESVDRKVTCPLCRGDWGEVKWSRDYACDKSGVPKKESARDSRSKDTFFGSSCGKCGKSPLQGKRFSCVICRHFDLCEACFEAGVHSAHPFVVQEDPSEEPKPAPRAEADLENFEYKAPSSSKAKGKTTAAGRCEGTPRPPFRERAAKGDNTGNTGSGSRTEARRAPQQSQKVREKEEALGLGLGLSVEAQGLSLVAVGMSVKSTPAVGAKAKGAKPRSASARSGLGLGGSGLGLGGTAMRSSGRLSRTFSRSRPPAAAATPAKAGKGPPPASNSALDATNPLAVQALTLGIVGQRTSP